MVGVLIAVAVEPDLTGRLARCCDEAPVRPSSTNLAFFEFRGEGSREATETCGVCRMHRCVHDPDYHLTLVRGMRGYELFVERYGEHDFVARGAVEFDLYYCGHSGWD
jgi:hypothetical protein